MDVEDRLARLERENRRLHGSPCLDVLLSVARWIGWAAVAHGVMGRITQATAICPDLAASAVTPTEGQDG